MTARVRWHARWVVPVVSPPIADGTVITEEDRIVWVGERRHAPAAGRDEELGDAILTPGLVNAHTHLDLTVLRGCLVGLSFFDWVRTLTRAIAMLDDDDLLASASQGIAEGLRRGVTTYADTAPNAAAFDAMRAMGVRGICYREVFGPDPKDAEKNLATLADQVAAMRQRATELVQVGVSPHAPYSVSDALYAAVAELARRERLPVAVHIAESEAESRLVTHGDGEFAAFLQRRGIATPPRGKEPLDVIERAALLRPRTLLIHAVQVSDDGIRRIANAGCGVAHCPFSNTTLQEGLAPVHEMLRQGVKVGLGTDSLASNASMDLLKEGWAAAVGQRIVLADEHALSWAKAFRLATLGGAEALGLDEAIGSLEPGKQADLAAFAVSVEREEDVYAALLRDAHLKPARALRTVVAGRELQRDGLVASSNVAHATRVDDASRRLRRWRESQSLN
ncbi:amidohydrolase family protein [Pseudogemmatithrix spongiicola]|uniref:Amidohydrolase family protein n=1 Tax=Pseudogemmatithrix spongiicola TaxID=3062599 RepID=A0AA49Q4G0_9BACT|nr:amidohydrolase family protein [Gemmatimonadaceae bacterium 'strain 138']WKW14115.1 amidohydrolase family protein [Gemmatimonadaceae bacterium 'strain 318']